MRIHTRIRGFLFVFYIVLIILEAGLYRMIIIEMYSCVRNGIGSVVQCSVLRSAARCRYIYLTT